MTKLTPYKPWRHTRGVEAYPHSFITSAQHEGECQPHVPESLPLGKKPSTHWFKKLPCEDTPGNTAMPKPRQFLHLLKKWPTSPQWKSVQTLTTSPLPPYITVIIRANYVIHLVKLSHSHCVATYSPTCATITSGVQTDILTGCRGTGIQPVVG
jgi:hypothetical protein